MLLWGAFGQLKKHSINIRVFLANLRD